MAKALSSTAFEGADRMLRNIAVGSSAEQASGNAKSPHPKAGRWLEPKHPFRALRRRDGTAFPWRRRHLLPQVIDECFDFGREVTRAWVDRV